MLRVANGRVTVNNGNALLYLAPSGAFLYSKVFDMGIKSITIGSKSKQIHGVDMKTVKQIRKEIIDQIKEGGDYSVTLALEWNASDEKYCLLQELGQFMNAGTTCDRWIYQVEGLLMKVWKDMTGKKYEW